MDSELQRTCPCGTGKLYQACCYPIHRGAVADSAETVMRARYAAFAVGRVAYLVKSTHPTGSHFRTDQAAWRRDLNQSCQQLSFMKLAVMRVEDGDSAEIAFVTFRATVFHGKQDRSFQERSEFRRIGKRWLYYDGVGTDLT
jgi:SEC-C motif-containing protein